MEPEGEPERLQSKRTLVPAKACEHGRLIDDVLTRGGKRTGKVRCLECGAEIDDPHQSQK